MSAFSNMRARVAALLGVSAYAPARGYGPDLEDAVVERVREAIGGNLQPLPTTKLRWYLADLERAQAQADTGDLAQAAQLYRSMQRDGVIKGLLKTRTGGLVQLPKRFYGDREIADALRAENGTRSVFDEMFPPSELELLASDGAMLGVGVAELVPVEGRDHPVMVRLDPEYLRFRWSEGRWYFNSVAGALPITPGDGRWILHTPGGRMAPWNSGIWAATGRSFINKEHALLHRSNYSAKLANPARYAKAPIGASEPERRGMLRNLIAWGVNTVFELPLGWDVGLLESKGEGFGVFQEEIKTSDEENMVAICGQVVTVTGGAGFQNSNIHETVKENIVNGDGIGLGYTINTQGIPQFVVKRWGIGALERATLVQWETAKPKDRTIEANTLTAIAAAVTALRDALAPFKREIDIDALATKFAIPVKRLEAAVAAANDGNGNEANEANGARDEAGDLEEAA